MSIFANIDTWAADATTFVEGIVDKAESELNSVEVYTKANAPVLAAAVDNFLTVAQSVATDIDPAVVPAIVALEKLFDGLVTLIENAVSEVVPETLTKSNF